MPNQPPLAQKKLAQECADWIQRKVEIRPVTRTGFLHGKMDHVQDGKVAHAVLGSSNFTAPGLGLLPAGATAALLAGHGGVLSTADEPPHADSDDFELPTWVVIVEGNTR